LEQDVNRRRRPSEVYQPPLKRLRKNGKMLALYFWGVFTVAAVLIWLVTRSNFIG
jgi:hypothetical protein